MLHADFDRRRLADRLTDRLALKFHAVERQFKFGFQRSHPIFAPGTTIKMTGRVSEQYANRNFSPSRGFLPRNHSCCECIYCTSCLINKYLFFCIQKGNGYTEIEPPDILTFSSPKNDAAITFINSSAVNGVVFQHGHAFDVVASSKLLVVIQHVTQVVSTPQTFSKFPQ